MIPWIDAYTATVRVVSRAPSSFEATDLLLVAAALRKAFAAHPTFAADVFHALHCELAAHAAGRAHVRPARIATTMTEAQFAALVDCLGDDFLGAVRRAAGGSVTFTKAA